MNSPVRAVANQFAMAKSLYSFIDLVKHPEHLDRVFEIADSLSKQRVDVLERMRDRFAESPTGASAIAEKMRLHVNLGALSKLPLGTLGHVFGDHMRRNALDPAALPVLAGDDDLGFVRAHLYETHDVWHAVTGFEADVAGELGLQAFYAAQTGGGLSHMLLAMGFLNTALYATGDGERRLNAIARGWEMGRRAKPLFGVRWDKLWESPVTQVRSSFDVIPYGEQTAPVCLTAES